MKALVYQEKGRLGWDTVPDTTIVGPTTVLGHETVGTVEEIGAGVSWLFGYLIDGLHAECARVPFAAHSVDKLSGGLTDEQVLFRADILPTADEVGGHNGMVSPGDTNALKVVLEGTMTSHPHADHGAVGAGV